MPRNRSLFPVAIVVTSLALLGASWSPDGKQIAYSFIGGPENIYLMNSDGGSARVLVEGEMRSFRPEWSPDGSHLVFTGVVEGVHVIMRVDRDGSDLRPLSTPEEAAGDPDYSPDGGRLIFFTDEPLPRDLFVRELASGKVTALTRTPEFQEMSPRWAPDGRRVAFVGKESHEGAESDIWILDTETGSRRNLTVSPEVGEFHPDWSHDGSRVLYIRTQGGRFDVAMRTLESGEETILASGNGFAVLAPHFAPDDRAISFTRTDFAEKGEGMPAIVRVSLADGEETKLVQGVYLSRMATQDSK